MGIYVFLKIGMINGSYNVDIIMFCLLNFIKYKVNLLILFHYLRVF